MEFDVPESMIKDILASLDEMQQYSNECLSEFDPYTGMIEDNKSYQIRTGIIQDPNYPAFKHRVDDNDNEIEGLFTTTNPAKAKYPLNCKNSVDSYGMRVSVVWLDGNETGLHHDATQSSTVGKPVQKLWLTFPQAWSDRDRSCGDFSLPVNGTVCRIAMVRGDVGMFLGALPTDKENLPNINPGDFLRRTYNQNSQYITNNTTKDAHTNVLDKDIFKKKIKLQAVSPNDKEYEDDTNKLENVYHYHGNRHVIAKDGVSTATKVCANKHGTVCNKRVFEWNTNLDLNQAFDDTLATLSSIENFINVQLLTTNGAWSIIQTEDNKFITTLDTTMNLFDVIDLVKDKLEQTKLKTININAADASITISLSELLASYTITTNNIILNDILFGLGSRFNFTSGNITCADAVMSYKCEINYTLPSFQINSNLLTITEIAAILALNFVVVNTVNANIISADASMNWVLRRGSIFSSITPAETLVAAATAIMGRPGKYFSAVGVNRVISGDCPLPDTPITIPTCMLPNI